MVPCSQANMEVVRLTQQLIQIRSENPIGDEEECGKFVAEWLQNTGAEVQTIDVSPRRKNVIATLRGSGEKPSLVILGHMDTVPAGDGWSIDPFAGIIKDNKLFGRGAADMKGGLAAAMVALKRIASQKVELKGDLIVVATVDEEGPNMSGAVNFGQLGIVKEDTLVIATEPTGNNLCLAQKGVMWYEVSVFGRMCHAGNAHLGSDANHGLAWIINTLKQKVASLQLENKYLGKPTLTVGKMQGGIKTNVVPNFARAEIDFRLVPPLDCEIANGIIHEVVEEVKNVVDGVWAEVKNLGMLRPPIEVEETSPVVKALETGFLIAAGYALDKKGFPAYTDAGVIHLMTGNRHCVLFGPGDLEVAHSVDEFVPLEQLIVAADTLTEAIKAALG